MIAEKRTLNFSPLPTGVDCYALPALCICSKEHCGLRLTAKVARLCQLLFEA